MFRKLSLMILIAVITIVIFNSCHNSTEPQKPEIKPGRRDYTWTIDTVQIWGTYLMKMWGSSPTDVWAVGSGSDYNEEIWHYDGKEWKTDGVWRGIHPWCIYGFAKNDIWIAGSDGEIWHYDGNDWSESLSYSKELNYKYPVIIFYNIWGVKPNDIYAVGLTVDSNNIFMSIMMHYDGAQWERVSIELEGSIKDIKKGNKTSNKCFIYNKVQFTNPDTGKYFEFDGERLNEIQSSQDRWHSLTIIDDEVVFTIDSGIYTYNEGFNLIAKNPYTNNYQSVYGRNLKDIIWMMSDGLTHYNGTDFKYILQFDNKSLSDGVIFENEVFFVANDFYNGKANNLIYHGVLK